MLLVLLIPLLMSLSMDSIVCWVKVKLDSSVVAGKEMVQLGLVWFGTLILTRSPRKLEPTFPTTFH